MDKDKLVELAERCEAATGPDRNLDQMILARDGIEGVGAWSLAPAFTASIDAAMTLVPERHLQPSDIVRDALNALGRQFHLHAMHWPLITPYEEYLARFICAAALRSHAK